MKKVIASACMYLIAGTIWAGETSGEPCSEQSKYYQVGNDVFTCQQGRWKHYSTIGTQALTIKASLWDGQTNLLSATFTGHIGEPILASQIDQERSGYYLLFIPTGNSDGSISIDFNWIISQGTTREVHNTVLIEPGKEVSIPISFRDTAENQYTLKIKATNP